jgi:hypothetical protein
MLRCAQFLAKTTGPVSSPEKRGNDPEAVHSGHRPIEFNPPAAGASRTKPHSRQLGESAPAYGCDHPRRLQGLTGRGRGCPWSPDWPHRHPVSGCWQTNGLSIGVDQFSREHEPFRPRVFFCSVPSLDFTDKPVTNFRVSRKIAFQGKFPVSLIFAPYPISLTTLMNDLQKNRRVHLTVKEHDKKICEKTCTQ